MRGDLQAGWTIYRHRDFLGGENRIILPEKVQPNQLYRAKNCVFTGDGILETRQGKQLINTASLPNPIISVHRYVKEDGTGYILVQSGTTLYAKAWDGTSTLADLTTGAVTKTVTGDKLRSVVWRNNIILTNGSNNPFRFDGTAFTDLAGSPPKSKVIRVYAAKLFLVDVANPNNINFSGLEDYDSWDGLDVIKVNSSSGDTITGLASQPDGLVIFKRNETWVLTGFDRYDMRMTTAPINVSVGALSPDAIIDQGLVYGGDNLYRFTLNEVVPLSDTHRTVFSSMPLTQQQSLFAAITPESGRIILWCVTECLNVESRFGGILSWDNLNAGCFATNNGPSDDGTLLVGSAIDGYIYKMSNGVDDNGTEITTQIWDSYRDYALTRRKVWRKFAPELETFVQPTKWIFYNYDVDFGSTSGSEALQNLDTGNSLIWGQGLWGTNAWSNGWLFYPTYYFTARGNRISFRIKTGQRIRYYGYDTKYRQAGAI